MVMSFRNFITCCNVKSMIFSGFLIKIRFDHYLSLPLSRPSAVLRYLFLTFFFDFPWISDHDKKCTMHHAPWSYFVFLLIKKL
jgi:hypothetical protein